MDCILQHTAANEE